MNVPTAILFGVSPDSRRTMLCWRVRPCCQAQDLRPQPELHGGAFAMVFATVLYHAGAVMMTIVIRGRRLGPESANPGLTAIYNPVLRLALRWRWALLGQNLLVLALTILSRSSTR